MIAVGLIILGLYLACGIIFALPFVVFGVQQIDAQARRGSWGFRLLIIPGAAALWPWLLFRWLSGGTQKPDNHNSL